MTDKIYDSRAEAERLVSVRNDMDRRGYVLHMCGEEIPIGDDRSDAEETGDNARAKLTTALTDAFAAGIQSEHERHSALRTELRLAKADIEALRGADWGDKPLPEDAAISAAHPVRSGRHDEYAEAMRLVGAKRSKSALVGLVTWLLVRNAELQGALAEACDGWAAEYPRTSDELVIARLRAVLGSKP